MHLASLLVLVRVQRQIQVVPPSCCAAREACEDRERGEGQWDRAVRENGTGRRDRRRWGATAVRREVREAERRRRREKIHASAEKEGRGARSSAAMTLLLSKETALEVVWSKEGRSRPDTLFGSLACARWTADADGRRCASDAQRTPILTSSKRTRAPLLILTHEEGAVTMVSIGNSAAL